MSLSSHEEPAPTLLRDTHNAARAQRLAGGMGLFSLGLGLFGLFAPTRVTKLVGVRACNRSRRVVQAAALGQLAAGIGLLSSRRTVPWMWSRAVGDVVNLGLLTTGVGLRALPPPGAALAGAGLAGLAAFGSLAALRTAREFPSGAARGIYVNAWITIQRTPQEVYSVWRDLQNLPRFMAHLEAVNVQDDSVQLRARLPAGLHLEWQARISEDVPNEKIAWTSLPDSALKNSGVVTFSTAPGERGTQVHLMLNYEPLGGAAGHALMKLFGALPVEQARADLRRLKQILETGGLVHSDASIHKGAHPARPADDSQELAQQRSQGSVS